MKVLFTCCPAYGHLLPMLPLAHAARRAGHEVVVASGAEVAQTVSREGLAFWEVGPSLVEAVGRYLAENPDLDSIPPDQRIPRDIAGIFAPAAESRAADLVPRAVEWKPDLVVHELTEFAGAVAAAHAGARHAVHGITMFPPGMLPAFVPSLGKLFTQWNVPELVDGLLDAVYIDPVPRALQPDGPAAFRRVQALRPGMPPPAGRLPFDLGELPYADTVYLTLGTVFNQAPQVFETALEGLERLPVNVIVTVGPGADPTRLGRRPPHVRVTDYVPQELLLPHCRLVVSHGGTGSVTGALANGLPQLILPQGADNFLNATAVTRAGVGLALPPDALTSDAIADAAARLVSEPAFEAAARAVRAELAELPSAEEVLDGLLAA